MPDVSPLTVIGDEPVPVNDPGVDIAVNDVAVPPVVDAVYATDTLVPFPKSVTVPMLGASGTSAIGDDACSPLRDARTIDIINLFLNRMR